ncbi:MAG: CaiB/BaiF CoA transferase family protein [Halobacteriales archaeon]
MDLSDVRVVDLTRLLPGPYATQLLADLGAEVVKIEDTGAGDMARYTEPVVDGVGGLFASVNRGKRSVSLDLKSEGGRDAFHAVAREADAVVEGFRPGVASRLGVDYDSVREHNPDVVYVSLTGYGQEGERSDAVGHDLNYVGHAGLLDMTRARGAGDGRAGDEDGGRDAGSGEGEPVIPGYPVADMSGGLTAAFAVVSGLLSRELGDGGGYVDVSMTDVVTSMGQAVVSHAAGGGSPRPGETELTGGLACYGVYECADGDYVTLAALEPKFWRAFCEAVDRDDLASRHMEAGDELRSEIAAIFEGRAADDWLEFFDVSEVPVGPVKSPGEALDDARERGLVRGELLDSVGAPFVADVPGADDDVPTRGEHTAEVLVDAGYSESEVEALRERGDVA